MRETALVTDVILSMFLLGVLRVELEGVHAFHDSRHPHPHTTVSPMVTREVLIFLEPWGLPGLRKLDTVFPSTSRPLQHHQKFLHKNGAMTHQDKEDTQA